MRPRTVRVVIRLALLALLAGAPLAAGARAQIPFHDPYVWAGAGLKAARLGDADGDGESDLFVRGFNGDFVQVLLGHGGHFSGEYHHIDEFVRDFVVADFDGDGRDDVATTDDHGPGVKIWMAIG